MSVPVRAPSIRGRAAAVVGAVLALVLTGCGNLPPTSAPAPVPVPGQAPGTVVAPAGADVPTVVRQVQDAITAGGGVVVTTVDHTATARAVGVQLPPTTEVIGGPAAAGLPLLRVSQVAGANLPQHYLVRQGADGAVTVTANSAEYVAAVSGVTPDAARTALHDATAAVLNAVAPGSGSTLGSPLVGITPTDYLITLPSAAAVPATVDRLRRGADRAPTRSVGLVDLATPPADGGPPLRPTTLVLVTLPDAEAALVAAAPTFGIDLPMRFLVWADEQNRTQVGYPTSAGSRCATA
ncbi:hypothetical protein BJF78_21220 [Pseudonocardia sp. CNS-139]|nr:hypothetical protein BJF78_21220 [Pseudonocardia sp. CNS-139]